jgi:SAM-dependent methyltransferase
MTDALSEDRELKARAREMWASGDFPAVARTVTPVGPRLVAASGIGPGQRVLDVATGAGNTAIAAAAAGAEVVAADLTPELFEAGRRDAAAAGVALEWVEADCEALPFPDASFDVVASSFGAMFAPHHQVTADELVRVCRPGGLIAMTNWTPQGWIGQFFLTHLPYMPPLPPGASPPPLWGVEDHVRALLGDRVSSLEMTREVVVVDQFRTPEGLVAFYCANFGPTILAGGRVDGEPERRAAFDAALLDFARRTNLAAAGEPARYEFEYLLVLARRAG